MCQRFTALPLGARGGVRTLILELLGDLFIVFYQYGSVEEKERFFFLAYPTRISLSPTVARKWHLTWGGVRWLVHDVSMMTLTSFWRLDVIFDVLTLFSRQFPPNVSTSTYERGAELNISWSKKCSYFSVKLIKPHIQSWMQLSKEEYARKRMLMVVWFELKFPSLGITRQAL